MQNNNIQYAVPPGYEISNGVIVDARGNSVTNGTISIIEIQNIKKGGSLSEEGKAEQFLILEFSIKNGETKRVSIPYKDIATKKVLDYVPVGFYIMLDTAGKQQRFLSRVIFSYINKANKTESISVPIGYSEVNDRLIYNLGGEIINGDGLEISNGSDVQLVEYKKPICGMFEWIKAFCKQGSAQTVMFLAAMMPFVKPVISVKDYGLTFAVYIVGKTGRGKSEQASLLTNLYVYKNDSKTSATQISLESDKIIIFETLDHCMDQNVLVDNLNMSSNSSADKRKRENTLTVILHHLSSKGSVGLKNKKYNVNSMIFVSAEYLLKDYSTINRTLVVKIEKAFDAERLTFLQKNTGAYIDFIKKFIEWICCNAKTLKNIVGEWPSQKLNVQNEEKYEGVRRMSRTYETIKCVEDLLLLFFEKQFKLNETVLSEYRTMFDNAIEEAVGCTLDECANVGPEAETYYVERLLDIFIYDYDKIIAENMDEYKEFNRKANKKNKKLNPDERIRKKVFFRKGQYYHARPEDVLEAIKHCISATPLPASPTTKQSISAQLKYYGLLHINQGKSSYPVADYGKGTRFYYIWVPRIMELFEEDPERFANADRFSKMPEFQHDINQYAWLDQDDDENDNVNYNDGRSFAEIYFDDDDVEDEDDNDIEYDEDSD